MISTRPTTLETITTTLEGRPPGPSPPADAERRPLLPATTTLPYAALRATRLPLVRNGLLLGGLRLLAAGHSPLPHGRLAAQRLLATARIPSEPQQSPATGPDRCCCSPSGCPLAADCCGPAAVPWPAALPLARTGLLLAGGFGPLRWGTTRVPACPRWELWSSSGWRPGPSFAPAASSVPENRPPRCRRHPVPGLRSAYSLGRWPASGSKPSAQARPPEALPLPRSRAGTRARGGAAGSSDLTRRSAPVSPSTSTWPSAAALTAAASALPEGVGSEGSSRVSFSVLLVHCVPFHHRMVFGWPVGSGYQPSGGLLMGSP